MKGKAICYPTLLEYIRACEPPMVKQERRLNLYFSAEVMYERLLRD